MTRRTITDGPGSDGRSGRGTGVRPRADLALTVTASALMAAIVFLVGAAIPAPTIEDIASNVAAQTTARQYPCDWPDEWELCADPLRWPSLDGSQRQ